MPLPTLPLRSHGVRVLQSRNLNSLGSYWLTSSPLALGFPQALGSSTVRRPDECEFASSGIPLLHFDATSASLTTRAAHYSRRMPTIRHFHEAPRKALALQHDRFEEPFFHFRFRKRSAGVAIPAKGPALRVWLPFQRRLALQTLKVFSNLPHSWGSPFEVFLQPCDQNEVSYVSFVPTLSCKTYLA